MRVFLAFFVVMAVLGPQASAQSCTGLACQQVSCPGSGTTSISGTVYAPNNTDPLPNVLVYIPNAAVDAFTPGVSCPVVGQPPSGSPLVGAITAVDGTFTITNVPVGTSIPLVIQTGRWRRQVVVPTTTACTNTAFSTRMPQNQTEGDIPFIAIATGSADQVECVLRKVGIADSEFTAPGGGGRINLYPGSGSPGAQIGTTTPTYSETDLMGTSSTLNGYDMVMLPCQGSPSYTKSSTELSNLIQFANAGGRVYTSHYGYVWMYENPPFSGVANWLGTSTSLTPDPGTATVVTNFSAGNTLSQWLQLIGASTTQGQIAVSTLRKDLNGVIAPTQAWLTLNNATYGNPVMQFVFDTPIGSTANQCGRVLFNEYHVENPVTSPAGDAFPSECLSGGVTPPMTPQEKLLEYSLFELTSDGSSATLTPTTQDFGSEPVGFTSAAQTFTWTNNSTFGSSVTLLTATGDFSVASNNCTAVASGASCQINVVFLPTALGARTGTLTVGSSGSTLTASLTGTGTPGLTLSPATSLTFGNVDVGGSATQAITVTNTAPGGIPVPSLSTVGDYSATTNCASIIPANSSCTIFVQFNPTATGTRTGSLTVTSGYSVTITLTGNGIDFSIVVDPTSGTVIAGYSTTTTVTTAPIAGFAALVTLSCTTNATASNCVVSVPSFVLAGETNTPVNISTTAKYTVIGYQGTGGSGLLWLVAFASTWLLWTKRKGTALARCGVLVLLLVAAFSLTACSGKLPAENPSYTAPGSYTYTLTATDGTITHSVTYTLGVTVK